MYVSLGRAEPAPRTRIETPAPLSRGLLRHVLDPTTSEFGSICRIVVKTNGGHGLGTGVLIGPRHVLTCAHVIRAPQNPNTTGIAVFVGASGPDQPGRAVASNGWAVSPGWSASDCRAADEDYGLIRLQRDVATHIMPVTAFAPERVLRKPARMAGYPSRPADPEARSMFRSRGWATGTILINACGGGQMRGRLLPGISNVSKLVAHNLDSAPSMSGSPLWSWIDGVRVLWGIHAGDVAGGQHKKAILLNSAVRARIAHWMARTLPPL